jgi:hypothetical protein
LLIAKLDISLILVYNIYEVREMEKTVTMVGFLFFWICFALTLLVSTPFAIGCPVGLVVMGLGWFFWDE